MVTHKRTCPWCSGTHRKKKAAKACAIAHGKGKKAWTLVELGLGGK